MSIRYPGNEYLQKIPSPISSNHFGLGPEYEGGATFESRVKSTIDKAFTQIGFIFSEDPEKNSALLESVKSELAKKIEQDFNDDVDKKEITIAFFNLSIPMWFATILRKLDIDTTKIEYSSVKLIHTAPDVTVCVYRTGNGTVKSKNQLRDQTDVTPGKYTNPQ